MRVVTSTDTLMLKTSLPVTVNTNTDGKWGKEGYELEITTSGVAIEASGDAGVFYACQTLRQWLPDGARLNDSGGGNPILLEPAAATPVAIPCVTIGDVPKYAWRGFMLDSGRQYQSVDYIKRTLDILAHYKFNVFHWHLTEGHGWRLEIDRYPKLTSVGSKVGPWPEQEGFYSKQEVRDLVAYAAARHITIVPEIEIPGHSTAALIAYPELTCLRRAPKAEGLISPHIFCAGREQTYTFLENVLDEVCEMFPGKYIHLGGDEAPKTIWQKCPDCRKALAEHGLGDMHALQIHMTNRLADHLGAKGRTAICWGDVVTLPGPELRKNVAVMWWNYRRHQDLGLRKAVELGHEVIMAPNYYCYLNFPVTPLLPHYGVERTFDLRMAYEKNPVLKADELPLSQRNLVLGINPCLWTDHNLVQSELDERVYPRLLALAELAWHTGPRESFDHFSPRIRAH
ncbi:MAG: beta-N-acetylhexosaminidase, partial [Verrucomicrobiae bacterium]|nr:beta-N-acetylhexosaminidase [Verrucomicrobiae bacterium]